MKTIIFRFAALATAFFYSLHLFAATPSNEPTAAASNAPALRLQASDIPKKTKCRKCYLWRPERLFKKGQWDASFGMGVVPTFVLEHAKAKSLPFTLGLEYRFKENISLGVMAGRSVSETQSRPLPEGGRTTFTNSFYHFSVRPAVHITRKENWDFYGGFSVGVYMQSVEGKTSGNAAALRITQEEPEVSSRKITPAFSGLLGLRYVLTPRWTLRGEAGFGVSLLTVGVGFRLG